MAYKLIQGILAVRSADASVQILIAMQEERDEVLLEVQILRKSSHPNIIGLVGAWSTQPNELVVRIRCISSMCVAPDAETDCVGVLRRRHSKRSLLECVTMHCAGSVSNRA